MKKIAVIINAYLTAVTIALVTFLFSFFDFVMFCFDLAVSFRFANYSRFGFVSFWFRLALVSFRFGFVSQFTVSPCTVEKFRVEKDQNSAIYFVRVDYETGLINVACLRFHCFDKNTILSV